MINIAALVISVPEYYDTKKKKEIIIFIWQCNSHLSTIEARSNIEWLVRLTSFDILSLHPLQYICEYTTYDFWIGNKKRIFFIPITGVLLAKIFYFPKCHEILVDLYVLFLLVFDIYQ